MSQLRELQTLLYNALAEPIGLLVKSSDPNGLVAKLRAARDKAEDPALSALQFRRSPFAEGDLLILKSDALEGAPR